MVDIKIIRNNPEKTKKAVASKGHDPKIIDQVLDLDKKWRELLKAVENLRKERNEIAKKGASAQNIARGQKIKKELKKLEAELTEISKKYEEALYKIPNLPADDVPIGKDETENKVIKSWGEPRKFSFKPLDHVEIGKKLDIIDIDRAAKVSGSRFAYLKGAGVLLEFALVQLAIEVLTKENFTSVIPPTLIKTSSMRKMGYMEHGGDEDMFRLTKDNLVLVGTSEQSIGPMHKDEIIDVKKPLRYMGFSSCFRREAGSYGKDTRGILRVHQFDKVEMFSYTSPEDSDKEHEFLLSLEEKLFQSLEIPYQVVKMCTGDLGVPAARKYDIEAWIPSQGKYREVTSTSNTTDFQARRLNIKYQTKNGKTEFVHMLNGTAFAIGRTIIAILENYQQEDGLVKIPKVLQKYMGTDVISK